MIMREIYEEGLKIEIKFTYFLFKYKQKLKIIKNNSNKTIKMITNKYN